MEITSRGWRMLLSGVIALAPLNVWAAVLVPALWLLLLLSGVLGLAACVDWLWPSKIVWTDRDLQVVRPFGVPALAIPWSGVDDVSLANGSLCVHLCDRPLVKVSLLALGKADREHLVAALRTCIPEGHPLERLRGQSTFDGLVVPVGRAVRWHLLLPVFASLLGLLMVVGARLGPLLPMTAVAVLVAMASSAVMAFRSPRSVRCLRIGRDHVALLEGEKVTWRLPLFEVVEAEVKLGSALAITHADGRVFRVPFGQIESGWQVAERLARAINEQASHARALPEATRQIDPRLATLGVDLER